MKIDADDPRWTAYVLGELADEKERIRIEALLEESADARSLVEEIRSSAQLLVQELRAEPALDLSSTQLRLIESRMKQGRSRFQFRYQWAIACAASAALVLIAILTRIPSPNHDASPPKGPSVPTTAYNAQPAQPDNTPQPSVAESRQAAKTADAAPPASMQKAPLGHVVQEALSARKGAVSPGVLAATPPGSIEHITVEEISRQLTANASRKIDLANLTPPSIGPPAAGGIASIAGVLLDQSGAVIPGGQVEVKDQASGTVSRVVSNQIGAFSFPNLQPGEHTLTASMPGFRQAVLTHLMLSPGVTSDVKVTLAIGATNETVMVTAGAVTINAASATISAAIPVSRIDALPLSARNAKPVDGANVSASPQMVTFDYASSRQYQPYDARIRFGKFNTEAYDHIRDNPFQEVAQTPLSTFSIDVDTASYANMRRFLNNGQLPPKDSVRIEELVNYFSYDYASPNDGKPFAAYFDITEAPWNPEHRLLRIGIKGRELRGSRPPCNLVFLLDVSGSMADANKLPFVKESMRLLLDRLTEDDRVAIVIYATEARILLPSTRCDQKAAIRAAIDMLHAGGSTNGAGGIQLAYEAARMKFLPKGVNRVILATDGDFNVGITNRGDLTRLIEEQRKSGIFLSALGFGMGNLKDATLEMLADKGDGNYAYIDTLNEARKVLADELDATLVTIAKDVKIQIEFNPAEVSSYRLIGYENRLLRKEDFNNDTKDAGEIGAGHEVTVFYEIVPVGQSGSSTKVDPLKYQRPSVTTTAAARTGELLTLKIRYKQPEGDASALSEYVVRDQRVPFSAASRDFKFAAAVAAFGMLLRESPYKGNATLEEILQWAKEGRGEDPFGYRQEFIELLRRAGSLHR